MKPQPAFGKPLLKRCAQGLCLISTAAVADRLRLQDFVQHPKRFQNGRFCFPGFAGGSGTPAARLAAARRFSIRAILYLVVRSALMIDDPPSI